MRSCNSYQDIKTPEELEEERLFESICKSLLNDYDPEDGDYKAYQNWCRKQARDFAKERCGYEENDERE